MDALTLLRYWKGNIHGGDKTPTNATNVTTATVAATGNTITIVTGVSSPASETEDEESDDTGPFFDLVFSVPEQDEAREATDGDDEDCDESDSSDELKLTVTSGSSGESTAVSVSDSPSNELFFNGGFVPVDRTTEINPKTPQFQKPIMKSAAKFRVMMLKLRNLKKNAESSNEETTKSKKELQKQDQTCTEASGNSMTVKFKVGGEEVPVASLFKRRNSSKPLKKRQHDNNETCSGSFEDKKFSKETMQKYLQKVKPLYVRVSQKYGEKMKFNGSLTFPGVIKQNLSLSSIPTDEQKDSLETNPKREKRASSEVEPEPPLLKSTGRSLKQGNLPAGLRVVCKHFGKTWPASTAIANATATAAPGLPPANRRDDTLLQQEDGIQSAIQYCKESFKALTDSDAAEEMRWRNDDVAGQKVGFLGF